MFFNEWSNRNQMLNSLQDAIEQGTHGRLSNLTIAVIDGAIVLEARSATYYVVQLALATVHAVTADSPWMTPAKLTFHVDGHELVLRNPNAKQAGRTDDDQLRRPSSCSTPAKSLQAIQLPAAHQLLDHWQSS